MERNRDDYWQFIRGVAILAVVYIHSESLVGDQLNSFNGLSYFFLRNLANFPVNMFFFLSGYFIKPIYSISGFYKRRLTRLVPPYLFYTLAYIIGRIAFGEHYSVKRVVAAVLFGTAATPLYFMVVLIYFTLLAPFLQKAVRSKKISFFIISLSPCIILLAYYLRSIGFDIWKYLKFSPVWLPFYYLGMVFKLYNPSVSIYKLNALLPVSYLFQLTSTLLMLRLGAMAYSQMRLSGMFYSLIVVLLVYEYSKNTKKSIKCKCLSKIGDDSEAIYYMHWAFLMLINKVFSYSSGMLLPLYQLLEIVVTIVMCEIVVLTIKRIIKNKRILSVIGVNC